MARKSGRNLSNPRWQALHILQNVFNDGKSLDESLQKLKNADYLSDHRDYGLCAEIVQGCLRRFYGLQQYINTLLKSPIRQRDNDIELILIMGAYQLLYLRSNQYAVVNETVELTKFQNKHWAKGLVNGVLRKIIRDETTTHDISDEACYPKWIVDRCRSDWPEQIDSILNAGNQRAPMCLRLDLKKLNYAEFCRNSSLSAQQSDVVESAVLLESPIDVHEIPGFKLGEVSVQDSAAQIAATLLNLQPGQKVLDACAAPGGKTLHIAQLEPEVTLDAVDVSEKRLELVKQNLDRAETTANLIVGDASLAEIWGDKEMYDCILADVPCSGSGVIRRHPDIRILRRQSDIKALESRQRKILDSLWPLLKPGGILVYSTCSIFKSENAEQIEQFLCRWSDSAELPLDSVQWGNIQPAGRQILPGEHDMDGFYFARIQKKIPTAS